MTLIPWQTTVQNQYGSIVPSSTITVRDSFGNLATLYSSPSVVKSNPFVCGTDGFAQFYASPGTYTVQGSLNGSVTNTWNILLASAEATAAEFGVDSRSNFVTAIAGGFVPQNNKVYTLSGYKYIGKTGSTAISDLPGLIPYDEITFNHFGGKGDGSNESTVVRAAWNYLTSLSTGPTQAANAGLLPFNITPGTWRVNEGVKLKLSGFGIKVKGFGDVSRLRNISFFAGVEAFECTISDFLVTDNLGKPISSIVNNGSGKLRITTTTPHELSVGDTFIRLNGTGIYDNYADSSAILSIISPTVFDYDRAYVSTVTGTGAVGGDVIEICGGDHIKINRVHGKNNVGAHIILDSSASSTRMFQNRGEKSLNGLVFLGDGSNDNHDVDSVYENNAISNISVTGNGELKLSGTRGAGAGYNSTALGGWVNMQILSGATPSTVVENYYNGISLSGARMGGRRYDVASIADNGSGKIRVTTTQPHEFTPGYADIQLNSITGYSNLTGFVTNVISPTVFDSDLSYTVPASNGQIWAKGWDLYIKSLVPPTQLANDQFFEAGNINYTRIDGMYNIQFVGTRLKQQVWLTNSVHNNRILMVGASRGRDENVTQNDINPSGPGSIRGWTRFTFSAPNPVGFPTNGEEGGVIQFPNTTAGLRTTNMPIINETGVDKDGPYFKVNGKVVTIREVSGIPTISGAALTGPTKRVTVGGTGDAITLTTGTSTSGTIPTGYKIRWKASSTNTGVTTIALDGGSAIECRALSRGTLVSLPAGYILTTVDTEATYDGTYWVVSRVTQNGTNANGNWVKYSDGTMICDVQMVVKLAADATTGVKSAVWTYPATFINGATEVSVTWSIGTSRPDLRGQTSIGTNSTFATLYYNETAGTATDVSGKAIAIGRWFV